MFLSPIRVRVRIRVKVRFECPFLLEESLDKARESHDDKIEDEDVYFFENGDPKGSGTMSSNFTTINSIGSGISSVLNGYIAEIIIYNRKTFLNTERQNIERYLNRKYNLWPQN